MITEVQQTELARSGHAGVCVQEILPDRHHLENVVSCHPKQMRIRTWLKEQVSA